MEKPLQVTFHNLQHSDAIASDIEKRVQALEDIGQKIVGCRVVIDSPHNHTQSQTHKNYTVRIELSLPGKDLVVARDPKSEISAAVSDAFDTAKKQLREMRDKKQRSAAH